MTCYMCREAASVKSPPLLWIQHDGQGNYPNQLFSKRMLILFHANSITLNFNMVGSIDLSIVKKVFFLLNFGIY